MDDGQGRRSDTLVSVNLPPLPRGQAISPLLNHALPPLPSRPGTAVRLRPPTPPPRPDASLTPPPPHVRTLDGGAAPLLFSSLPVVAGGRTSLDLLPDQTITLTNPRTVRQQNVYVETPMKGLLRDDCILPPAATVAAAVKRPRVFHPHHQPKHKSSNPSNAVITQPLAAACKKVGPPPPAPAPTSPTDSIMCGECGRCRCAACRSARPLPSAWLCDNWCECSAEKVIDLVSCMCCVKAGLYHCGEGDPDTRDHTWLHTPCSCTSSKRLLRWSCLAVLSIPLPCLLCYPVLAGATKLAEKVYQAATTTGCRCSESTAAASPHAAAVAASSPTDSQKRLLS